MSDLNKVILIGRLTKDPELRHTQSGTSVASFSVANNKSYTANGEKKEDVSFFNCVAWGKLGEIITQYCKKGEKIAIDGRLQQRTWETQNGEKRYSVEIIIDSFQFLSNKNNDNESNNNFSDENIPF